MTRDAAVIGAGLEAARPARPIRPGERIHVVGIAGAGASAAALHAHLAGALVDGCDSGGPSPYTPAIEAAGIGIDWRHDPAHVDGLVAGHTSLPPERLAVTKAITAVDPDNPELGAARAAGIHVEPWQQTVADAAFGKTLVAVAGTHGKSTTTGWLIQVLVAAGTRPSVSVGALVQLADAEPPTTATLGSGDLFVVEADEYAGNFDAFRPVVAVLTNADWDHPDVFADEAAVRSTFESWIRRMEPGGDGRPPTLVANVGDPGVAAIASGLADWSGTILATALADVPPARAGSFRRGLAQRYATAGGPAEPLLGRVIVADSRGTLVEISGLDPLRGPVEVRLPTVGRHNAANALGVVGAALRLGIDPGDVTRLVTAFKGVGRRLERKGEVAGVAVYDDYAHHPTAIRATIAALRQREPGRRLWAVYEPLTYHRTAALLDEFASALATADAVAIADIWAGRDPDTTVASAQGLAAAVAGVRADIETAAPGSVEATADWLAAAVRSNDAVLVMGGGHSYRIGERLLSSLAADPSRPPG